MPDSQILTYTDLILFQIALIGWICVFKAHWIGLGIHGRTGGLLGGLSSVYISRFIREYYLSPFIRLCILSMGLTVFLTYIGAKIFKYPPKLPIIFFTGINANFLLYFYVLAQGSLEWFTGNSLQLQDLMWHYWRVTEFTPEWYTEYGYAPGEPICPLVCNYYLVMAYALILSCSGIAGYVITECLCKWEWSWKYLGHQVILGLFAVTTLLALILMV